MMIPSDIVGKKLILSQYLHDLGVDVSMVSNDDLMLVAFIHKSYAADYVEKIDFNERLEFLGDAVLGAVIAKYLFEDYKDFEESTLTLYKIALVREENLAIVARKIGLDKMIILGKGEERMGGRNKDTILGDSLEALIGYIFLDIGIEQADSFIKRFVYSRVKEISDINAKSPKTQLQEIVQKVYKRLPDYIDFEHKFDEKGNVIEYKSEVHILGSKYSEGYGQNKKKAQENAAKQAYEKICNIDKND